MPDVPASRASLPSPPAPAGLPRASRPLRRAVARCRQALTGVRPARALAVVAAAGLVLSACSTKTNTTTGSSSSPASSASGSSLAALEAPPAASVALTETGSSLLYPLFSAWAPAYHRLHSNVSITTGSTGSGTGITDAATGVDNIGASDAYLSSGQVTQYPGLENIPLAISAQMVNYNLPGFTGTLKLSGKVLSEIYQGTITKWNDPAIAALNSGVTLPTIPIVTLHRSDGSGDTFLFTTFLSDADPSGWGTKIGYNTTIGWPSVPGALGENGNGGMVTGCKATPGCVAYIGVSYEGQTTQDGLGTAELQNASGNFEPLNATTVAAEAASFASTTPASGAISLIYGKASNGYPIINYEYAIVQSNQTNAGTAQAIKALLAWAIDTSGGSASSFLNAVNFQPLPASAVSVATALLQKIT
jgi:phosphate transport system substrate-binding protein